MIPEVQGIKRLNSALRTNLYSAESLIVESGGSRGMNDLGRIIYRASNYGDGNKNSSCWYDSIYGTAPSHCDHFEASTI